ncbi:MAG: helix-turn-helix domain-containing protein [Candidatus Binataceae bacterium]
MRTFGGFIRQRRKAIGLTQREFAARIHFEDGHAISLPYLNHLEHNLRKPSRAHMIEQFAEALGVKCEVLFFLVGRLPDDIQVVDASDDQVIEAFQAFREQLRTGTGKGSTVSLNAVSGATGERIAQGGEDSVRALPR